MQSEQWFLVKLNIEAEWLFEYNKFKFFVKKNENNMFQTTKAL